MPRDCGGCRAGGKKSRPIRKSDVDGKKTTSMKESEVDKKQHRRKESEVEIDIKALNASETHTVSISMLICGLPPGYLLFHPGTAA